MNRVRIDTATAVRNERVYQDRKWGKIQDRPKQVGSWLTLMDVHLQRAKEAWATAPNDDAALDALRKVIAIGVACGEQHGLPDREAK